METRSWKTGYRGTLAIHASKFLPNMFFMGMDGKKMDIFAEAGLHGDNDILNLPYGALDTPRERVFGNWSPGRYGWILSNPILFEKPIPARGKQGIWDWEPEEM